MTLSMLRFLQDYGLNAHTRLKKQPVQQRSNKQRQRRWVFPFNREKKGQKPRQQQEKAALIPVIKNASCPTQKEIRKRRHFAGRGKANKNSRNNHLHLGRKPISRNSILERGQRLPCNHPLLIINVHIEIHHLDIRVLAIRETPFLRKHRRLCSRWRQ